MEHDIPFGNSNRENGPTFLDFPLFLGIFQWEEPTKRVPFTAEPEIPEILTKWKAPHGTWKYPMNPNARAKIAGIMNKVYQMHSRGNCDFSYAMFLS